MIINRKSRDEITIQQIEKYTNNVDKTLLFDEQYQNYKSAEGALRNAYILLSTTEERSRSIESTLSTME